MDLSCSENLVTNNLVNMNFAGPDPTMSVDPRIIPNLLNSEKDTMPFVGYFKHCQHDIQPYMRKLVTSWMLEVCDEQRCEEQVFPLAVNYMDRFLCTTPIMRDQLQLLGVCCLLMASKIRQCNTLSVELLCAYTDNSVTPNEVKTWELLVLTRLHWNICGVTAYDYVDHILKRVPWGFENVHIQQHSHTLVSICYTEMLSIEKLPSVLASACIVSAVRGLKSPSSPFALRDVCRLTNCDPFDVELTARGIEMIVARETAAHVKTQQKEVTNDNIYGDEMTVLCEFDILEPDPPKEVQEVRI